MFHYLVRRILQMIPAFIIISFVVFMIINLIPGDPATILAGASASEAQLQALTVKFGLDKPLLTRYYLWLKNLFQGDLGTAAVSGQNVLDIIRSRLGATIELTIVATAVSILIAIPVGVLSALRQNSIFDRSSTVLSAVFFAVPGFWLGILLILLFSLVLRVLPASGRVDFFENPLEHIRSIVLPVMTIALGMAARTIRYLRASLLDVLGQDYVVTARARGVKEKKIVYRHALKNALIPVVTIVGLQMGDLFGGALIIEQIFAWPGIGRLTIQAIGWRDYNLLQATVLYIVVVFMVVNLLTDILNAVVDPRVRLE